MARTGGLGRGQVQLDPNQWPAFLESSIKVHGFSRVFGELGGLHLRHGWTGVGRIRQASKMDVNLSRPSVLGAECNLSRSTRKRKKTERNKNANDALYIKITPTQQPRYPKENKAGQTDS